MPAIALFTYFYYPHNFIQLICIWIHSRGSLLVKLGWICPGVRLVEERGREGDRNIAFLPGLRITHGGRVEKWQTSERCSRLWKLFINHNLFRECLNCISRLSLKYCYFSIPIVTLIDLHHLPPMDSGHIWWVASSSLIPVWSIPSRVLNGMSLKQVNIKSPDWNVSRISLCF